MIKQKLFLMILFLISFNFFSQNNFKADYRLILKKNGYAPVYYKLSNNKTKSIFKFVKRDVPNKVVNDEETGEVILNSATPDSIQPLILTDFITKKITSKEYLTENSGDSYSEYIIKESISIKWVLVNETKKIGNYLCKKATTTFRGRNYSAWYYEKIPISVGPWKFHGLPGVIIRITDAKNQVSFYLEHIEYPFTENIKNSLYLEEEKSISVSDFFELKEKARDNSEKFFRLKLLSKLPRGATIELTKESNTDIEVNL